MASSVEYSLHIKIVWLVKNHLIECSNTFKFFLNLWLVASYAFFCTWSKMFFFLFFFCLKPFLKKSACLVKHLILEWNSTNCLMAENSLTDNDCVLAFMTKKIIFFFFRFSRQWFLCPNTKLMWPQMFLLSIKLYFARNRKKTSSND